MPLGDLTVLFTSSCAIEFMDRAGICMHRPSCPDVVYLTWVEEKERESM